MFDPDKENIAFITILGLYYYRVMLFGLKNTEATYHRVVTKMFRDNIGKSMEVYVDDTLVQNRKKKKGTIYQI